MELKEYLATRLESIDSALKRYLPSVDALPVRLHQAMHYSVFAGGKRIRPVLAIAACEAVGGAMGSVLPAACALEMIHTYSLIHDDLPVMDDDDYRRGRLTNHKVYGEATAVLAGDALLTDAFALLAGPAVGSDVSAKIRLRMVHTVARAAGAAGMVGGQAADMDAEGKETDLAMLQFIHTRKTGALILASVQVGALAGGGGEEEYAAITRYGEAAGLAFQIADDILDIVGEQRALGKDTGKDQARGKATYPAVLGVEQSRERARELRDLAIEALAPLGERAEPLRAIARFIVDRSC
jgi:geranylgeranyl diphosphate synthase, type II